MWYVMLYYMNVNCGTGWWQIALWFFMHCRWPHYDSECVWTKLHEQFLYPPCIKFVKHNDDDKHEKKEETGKNEYE